MKGRLGVSVKDYYLHSQKLKHNQSDAQAEPCQIFFLAEGLF